MSIIPVADTISEISERMSSLSDFGHTITQNIKHQLTVIKEKCSGQEKLDLSDLATQEWVGRVTDLFYLVDDLSADAALLSNKGKIMSLFSACNLKPLLQLKKIEKKVLRLVASMKTVKMLPNRDGEEEGEGIGYYVKEIIMESLKRKEERSVRAVVTLGIEGMVKSSLEKDVCDEQVKSGFDVVKWFGSVNLKNVDLVDIVNLKNHDNGRGFLVVLECYRNENRETWLKLAEKLKEVAATSSGGGILLVTTEKLAVARLVGSTFDPTEFLFDWCSPLDSPTGSLFERIAGTIESLFDMCGDHEAIEVLARLVRSRKPTSESKINQLKDEFLQEMQMKYYNKFELSSWVQRQCFAYSLFIFSSKNFMKPDNLVRLWMGEGFLGHSSSSSEPEDLGKKYIEQFIERKIFINTFKGEIGINPGMRVLTPVMLGKHSVHVENNSIIDNDVRRVSLSSELDVSKGIPRSLFETNKKVQTFLLEKQRVPNQVMLSWLACDAIFLAFRRLRVLTLKDLGMKELPASIGDLKRLKYLNLSGNDLKKLPDCVGELKHLHTLLLTRCLKLRNLPNGENHFVSLRHLDVDQCPKLMHMPSALNKLPRLQSLPHFVASTHNGVEELLHLNELRGKLEISHLERFKRKRSGFVYAYLKRKERLEGLTLRWNPDDEDGEKILSSKDLLDQLFILSCLEPHSNLQALSITGYGGSHLAGWLSSLNNLVEISLSNCPKCQSLPIPEHVLIKLKRLTLESLDSLEFITRDTDATGYELALEQVRISHCPNLTSWWKLGTLNTSVFAVISELVVEYCPKLRRMPLFPNLNNKLVLDCSNMEPLLNTLRYKSTGSDSPLSQLEHLTIRNVDVKQYPQQEGWLKNCTSLLTLEIRDCKSLKSIKGWKNLTSLDSLHISNCTGIDIPCEEWEGLENLASLVIEGITDMRTLPEGMKHLVSLNNLKIKNCPELTTVPDDISEVLQPFIKIIFDNCPKLDSLPASFTFTMLIVRNCPVDPSKQEESLKDFLANLGYGDNN